MSTYVVLLSHSMDDFPVFVTDDRDRAMWFANNLNWYPSHGVRGVFNRDCSTPNCISIVTFTDGLPVCNEIVRDYDNDPGDE